MRRGLGMLLAALIGVSTLAACNSGDPATSKPVGDCPVAPLPVVVSVDQWGDIVEQLAGDCGDVTTIIKSSAADPHDYEPTPSDIAAFGDAKLVVMNGLDYDPWVDKAIDTLDEKPDVVNGGTVVGLRNGDNPHIWYGPEHVYAVADAVTAQLRKLAPEAADHLETQQTAWRTSMAPYDAEIARITPVATGKAYGATESVFDYMATAVGLVDETPQGYQNAAANESDPAPGDVNEFQQALAAGRMNVLIFNAQTEGSVPDQIRDEAERSDVPVVDVTETVPPGTKNFVSWQIAQLRQLATALDA
ncbi:MAG: metal ABC transporter solute-binding protein, Zn/Mn family [Acidimicrobiia bacterium]